MRLGHLKDGREEVGGEKQTDEGRKMTGNENI